MFDVSMSGPGAVVRLKRVAIKLAEAKAVGRLNFANEASRQKLETIVLYNTEQARLKQAT